MGTPSHKLHNAQSDIWDAHKPVEGEFTLLPVGVPPLIKTNQTILLGSGSRYATAGQVWNPRPPTFSATPVGTLTAGEDFFPYYNDGIFYFTRKIQSMVMNGILLDRSIESHKFAFLPPSIVNAGFYSINLNYNFAPFSTTFLPIRNLLSGQVLTLTEITLATF